MIEDIVGSLNVLQRAVNDQLISEHFAPQVDKMKEDLLVNYMRKSILDLNNRLMEMKLIEVPLVYLLLLKHSDTDTFAQITIACDYDYPSIHIPFHATFEEKLATFDKHIHSFSSEVYRVANIIQTNKTIITEVMESICHDPKWMQLRDKNLSYQIVPTYSYLYREVYIRVQSNGRKLVDIPFQLQKLDADLVGKQKDTIRLVYKGQFLSEIKKELKVERREKDMNIYYICPYPYYVVVKYDNGTLFIDNDFAGKALDISEFIDKLLTVEQMDYVTECIPLAKKIEEFARAYVTHLHKTRGQ